MKPLVLLTLAWFFAVDASEEWFTMPGYTGVKQMGGWTHDGPYKTKQECERARMRLAPSFEAYRDSSHVVWHRPRSCRQENAEHARWLLEEEMRRMRLGR